MNCPVCDTPLPKNAAECPNCGAAIFSPAQDTPAANLRDSAVIRRQALAQMAAELAQKRQYDAALLTYRRALKGLDSGDPLHAKIQKHIQRIERQQQAEAEKFSVSPAPPVAENALKQPLERPTETEPEHPAAPTRFWVRAPQAYLAGLVLALGLSQMLQHGGFQAAGQVIFVLMLVWAAYSGQVGLLTLEWILGFGGSYLLSSGLSSLSTAEWISLALEGLALDLIFFYGASPFSGIRLLLGLALAGLIFLFSPFLPFSILILLQRDYFYLILGLFLLLFVVNRSPGNLFHRLFGRWCQTQKG